MRRTEPKARPKAEFEPEVVPSGHLTEKDIIDIPYGREVVPLTHDLWRAMFSNGKEEWEMPPEGCAEVQRLVAAISRSGGIGQRVSAETIEDQILRWLDPTKEDARTLTARLVEEISPKLEKYEAWIPIACLRVQSALPFGGGVIRPITRDFLDRWRGRYKKSDDAEAEAAHDAHFRELRERFQGLAAMTIEIEAESSRANELAAESADRLTTLLRTYCPENGHPLACSRVVPFGRVYLPSDQVWLAKDGDVVRESTWMLRPLPMDWVISDSRAAEMRKLGLDRLSEIIVSEKRTDLEERLLGALLLYNRANAARDMVDKLVFVLVSLEMLLLRNETEPIQQNLGDRLAFAVGFSPEQRQQISALVRKCYGIRSRYVHHGQIDGSIDTLTELFKYAMLFFIGLIQRSSQIASKDALLDVLDQRKYA